jgi:hypothetical protein
MNHHTRVRHAGVSLEAVQYRGPDAKFVVTVKLNLSARRCECEATADQFELHSLGEKPALLKCRTCGAQIGTIDTEVEARR